MSEDSFEVREPPNAEARANQFVDLSGEYLRLIPPRTSTPAYFTAQSPEAEASLREGLLAHMLMRKFITKGESVYIPRVIESLLQDYKDQIPRSFARELRTYGNQLSSELKTLPSNGAQYALNGRQPLPERTILDSYLNGRLLHSDYEKWENASSNHFRVMLGSWLSMRERFRTHLETSRHNLLLAVDKFSLFELHPGLLND